MVADYGAFSFSEKREDGYQYFGLRVSAGDGKSPSFDFMLDDGRSFNAGTLTIESAKSMFAEVESFESSTLDGNTQWMHFKQGPIRVLFCEGVLDSVYVVSGGKIRPSEQSEFVAIPIAESEMKRVFGEPKKYRRGYGSNP